MPRCGRCEAAAQSPSADPEDPGYRRLRYVQVRGRHPARVHRTKAEAEEIKRRLAQFLQDDLKLELSETKTLITHARTDAARFLGYEITVRTTTGSSPLAAGRPTVASGCTCPPM